MTTIATMIKDLGGTESASRALHALVERDGLATAPPTHRTLQRWRAGHAVPSIAGVWLLAIASGYDPAHVLADVAHEITHGVIVEG